MLKLTWQMLNVATFHYSTHVNSIHTHNIIFFSLWEYVKDIVYKPDLPKDLCELQDFISTKVQIIHEKNCWNSFEWSWNTQNNKGGSDRAFVSTITIMINLTVIIFAYTWIVTLHLSEIIPYIYSFWMKYNKSKLFKLY